jgi:polyhydroxyalkanoate synthesis regulator phasin
MNQPRPESRISSLERRASSIEAGIVELSNDTAEDLKALRNEIKALSEHVDLGFKQAHAYIQENIETRLDDHSKHFDRIETRLDDHSKHFDRIETRLDATATKEDITAMEERLIDIIKQLWQQKPSQ